MKKGYIKIILPLLVFLVLFSGTAFAAPKRYLVTSNWNYTNEYNVLRSFAKLANAKRAIQRQSASIRAEWYIVDTESGKQVVYPQLNNNREKIRQAVAWAKAITADNRHGYDCGGERMRRNTRLPFKRWGKKGDYSCSTLVIMAYELAGFENLRALAAKKKLTCTIEGKTVLGLNSSNLAKACKLSVRFRAVTTAYKKKGQKALRAGDVLIRDGHVAMYVGGGKMVQATCNENGGMFGGKPGDQPGGELMCCGFSGPWTAVFRPVA